MEHILKLIENHGVSIVLNGLLVYLIIVYSRKRQCVMTPEFKKIHDLLIEIKSLFQGFMYGNKYRGKDDD